MNINRIIFCDSENIQKDTLKALEVAREDDLVIIMCSPNTFKIEVYELNYFSECKGGIELFNCSSGTQNAMDFYIVSEVVASMVRNEANEYFIISNDKGYSPLIKLWNTRGYKLHLISDPDLLRYNLDNRRILQGNDVVNDFKTKNKVTYQVDGIKSLKFDNRTIVLKQMESYDDYEEVQEEIEEDSEDVVDNVTEDVAEEKSEIAIKIEEATKKAEENAQKKEMESSEEKEKVEDELKASEQEKIQQLNDSIKEAKEEAKKKDQEEIKDVTLEALEDEVLPTREFNTKKINQYVGSLSASKLKDLMTVISDYTDYTDEVEDLLKGIFKRNQSTYVEKVKNSWSMYRHE